MTHSTPSLDYAVSFGESSTSPLVPIFSTRNPTASDFKYPLGQEWINTSGNAVYYFTSMSTSSGSPQATWSLAGNNSGPLNTLTADSGGAISPSSGNINVLGTANQVTTAGAGSTITYSLPSVLIAPGSLEVTTTFQADGASTLAATTIVGTANINASGAGAQTTTIGNTTGASAIVQRVGTGNFSLDGAANSTYAIAASTVGGTISIGGTAQTGSITLGSSSGTNTVAIGAGSGTTTVAIAAGTAGGNTVSINNGVNAAANITNINAGAAAASSTVNVLSGNASAGTQTLNLCTGNAGYTIHVGDNAAGANVITVGNAAHAADSLSDGIPRKPYRRFFFRIQYHDHSWRIWSHHTSNRQRPDSRFGLCGSWINYRHNWNRRKFTNRGSQPRKINSSLYHKYGF